MDAMITFRCGCNEHWENEIFLFCWLASNKVQPSGARKLDNFEF